MGSQIHNLGYLRQYQKALEKDFNLRNLDYGFKHKRKLTAIEKIKNDTWLRIDERKEKKMFGNEKWKFGSVMKVFFHYLFILRTSTCPLCSQSFSSS